MADPALRPDVRYSDDDVAERDCLKFDPNKVWGIDGWVTHPCSVNNEPVRIVTHSKAFHRNRRNQLVAAALRAREAT